MAKVKSREQRDAERAERRKEIAEGRSYVKKNSPHLSSRKSYKEKKKVKDDRERYFKQQAKERGITKSEFKKWYYDTKRELKNPDSPTVKKMKSETELLQSVYHKLTVTHERLTEEEKPAARKLRDYLEARKALYYKGNNLTKFCPNGGQEEFIRAVGKGDHFIYGAFCGNGWGKTATVINVLGNIIWQYQPFHCVPGNVDDYLNENLQTNWLKEWGDPPKTWFTGQNFQKEWRFPKRVRIVGDPSSIDDVGAIQVEIDRWFPHYGTWWKGEKGKYPYRSRIRTNNQWIIQFMTYEQKVREFESETIGIHVFDEIPPEPIWDACIARMRKGGIILIAMTAVSGSAYLFDKLVDSNDPQVYFRGGHPDHIAAGIGDGEENCLDHGVRGALAHEHLERIWNQYSGDIRDSRKRGAFMVLSGKIHKDFEKDIHVITSKHDKETIPTREWMLANKKFFQFYQVVDPHDRKPDAIGYYAMDTKLRKYVIAEYPNDSRLPYHLMKKRDLEYTELIKQKLIPFERSLGLYNENLTRIMDPRYAQNQAQRGGGATGATVEDIWTAAYGDGFITHISDNFTAGRNALDLHLHVQNDGLPMMIFFEEYTKNHVYALLRWKWDEWEQKTQEKKDWKEVPEKKNSDYPRLLHYLCMYDPEFENRSVEIIGWRARLKKKKTKSKSPISYMGR